MQWSRRLFISIKEQLVSISHLKIFSSAEFSCCTIMLLQALQKVCEEKQMGYTDGRPLSANPFLNLCSDL